MLIWGSYHLREIGTFKREVSDAIKFLLFNGFLGEERLIFLVYLKAKAVKNDTKVWLHMRIGGSHSNNREKCIFVPHRAVLLVEKKFFVLRDSPSSLLKVSS